ncbi:hypothetical protein PHPALM_29314 [Phytophthora palmivora]|uniref:ATP-dependent DNA helicase n=1 Tax=Phytophthora palmivora TaxID=4796 RepID=A0A2P4X7W6_9STRA|nr:hypothetical protein PHPALM_29314 [Phytophthora palmivora]
MAVEITTQNQMLSNVASRAASPFAQLTSFKSFPHMALESSRFPLVGFLKQWVKDNSTDNKLIAEVGENDSSNWPTQVVELIRDALQPENMLWSSDEDARLSGNQFPTLAAVSKEFPSYPLQHVAFCKIGKSLLTRWLKTHPSQSDYQGSNFEHQLSRDQLLFFLGGAGGTGKSRIIDSVTRLCGGWKRDTCVLKTGLTGKAVTLFQGRTLASFILSLERSKTAHFLSVDIFVIDEVSMLTKPDWLKLDRLLRRYKRVPGVPFGGIHIVLVGDFPSCLLLEQIRSILTLATEPCGEVGEHFTAQSIARPKSGGVLDQVLDSIQVGV